ncbi:MAG: hypothetical protein CK528_06120 [Alcaligenaceae bacterium]|nr:MAG: hypothetical protein CK528_06120 [Alcaligenaceae bacterium]
MFLIVLIEATAIVRSVAAVVITATALMFFLVSVVTAQVVTEPRLPQNASGQGVQFKSSFSEYVPYTEQSIESWREANDRVGEIGGWRVYAKEAQQTRTQDKPEALTSPTHPQTKEGKQ